MININKAFFSFILIKYRVLTIIIIIKIEINQMIKLYNLWFIFMQKNFIINESKYYSNSNLSN